MLLPVSIYAIFVYVVVTEPGNTLDQSSYNLYTNQDTTQSPVRPGPSWTDRSRLSCINRCLTKHPPCLAVMYNKTTKLCTPGSYMSTTGTPTSTTEGDLYLKHASCDTSDGFQMVTSNVVVACLALFSAPLSYADAETTCASKRGFLASVNTLIKLRLMDAFASYDEMWIGCNDREVEGTFVWVEDYSRVTDFSIFAPGEPNDHGGSEDCCAIQLLNSQTIVNDDNCSLQLAFVCERSL